MTADSLHGFDAPPPGGGGPDYTDPLQRLKLDWNDFGHGARLAAVLRGEAIYVAGRGWGVWDGARFNFENGQARMIAKAACLQRLIEEEAAAADRQPIPEARLRAYMAEKMIDDEAKAATKIRAEKKAATRKHARACGNVAKVKSALEAATAAFIVDGRALDARRDLLQLPNGTLDLGLIAAEAPDAELPEEKAARWRAALGPHDRASLPTRVAGCAFDPEAEAPEFLRFVHLIMPDPAERAYLQRCCGMLLGGQRNEVMMVFLGEGGNGKSTLVTAIEMVMGSYSQTCRVQMFCESRNEGGSGPTPEEAVLPGARVYMASEPKASVMLDTGKVKGLTGGNVRQANPKNKDLFDYEPVGVPILQANRMPSVNDPSRGFWRRIYPVDFRENLDELPEAERRSSNEMKAILRAEASGILNWMLDGYAQYRAMRGLCPPAAVEALKGSLRALADPVGEFLDDRCLRGTFRVRTSDLHKAFVSWCEAQGDKAMGSKAFTAQMIARHFVKQKTEGHWYWIGLTLAGEGGEGDFL